MNGRQVNLLFHHGFTTYCLWVQEISGRDISCIYLRIIINIYICTQYAPIYILRPAFETSAHPHPHAHTHTHTPIPAYPVCFYTVHGAAHFTFNEKHFKAAKHQPLSVGVLGGTAKSLFATIMHLMYWNKLI